MPDSELERLLSSLNPSELGLRDVIVAQLDASMIAEIAAVDYGVDAVRNQDAIEELCRGRWFPEEFSRQPEEVLALTRP